MIAAAAKLRDLAYRKGLTELVNVEQAQRGCP